MNSVKRIKQFFWALFISLLILSGNTLIMFWYGVEEAEGGAANSRGVLGPLELLKNNGFSKVSVWAFQNASDENNLIIDAKYEDNNTPNFGQFKSVEPIMNLNVLRYAYINQTFTKTIWTPNYPTAIVCELDWKMVEYHSDIDMGNDRIDGEIFLMIINTSQPNIPGIWSIASGTGNCFKVDSDPRIGYWHHEIIPVGANKGSYSICPPGVYTISIMFRIKIPTGASVDIFECDLLIDNVNLVINDIYEPLVVANKLTYGPFNSDPMNLIDVDFLHGGLENVSLKKGKYRLNNSGIPGPWHTLFKNQNSYLQNWTITPIWNSMSEGNNIIDIYCIDDVGNYNDSVRITIVKDTVAPVSKVAKLNDSYTEQEINISYTAYDPLPSGGFNNSVELWFRYNQTGSYKQYKPPWNHNGLFNNSPISFNLKDAGSGYSVGMYEFYTRGIDNATNYEDAPKKGISTNITILFKDNEAPTPIFIAPEKKYNKGTVIVTVVSDIDTEYVEFYYWLDIDGDYVANINDTNSKWVFIDNVSWKNPQQNPPNNWTTDWNTLIYKDFTNEEHMVILKAIAGDGNNNRGEGYKGNIEIDNIAPLVKITNVAINNEFVYINYTTSDDVVTANFYFRDNEKDPWISIAIGVKHNYGDIEGSYKLKSNLFENQIPEIKIEVLDDTENIGEDIYKSSPPPKIQYPTIKDTFPTTLKLNEDFGRWEEKLSEYELHSNPDYSDNSLKWYVTGNTDTIFHITGNNDSTDTITYSSILNKCGTENLTFHLYDPLGLEATVLQYVIVAPVNDPPGPAIIIKPNEGFKTEHNSTINFTGTCDDPDLPYGDQLTFKWSSNLSGDLGLGANLRDISLSPGEHLITIEVWDLMGESAFTTTTLTITKYTVPQSDKNNTNDSTNNEDIKPGTTKDKREDIITIFIVILIVILIIIFIIIMLVRKKKSQATIINKKEERISTLPAKTVVKEQVKNLGNEQMSQVAMSQPTLSQQSSTLTSKQSSINQSISSSPPSSNIIKPTSQQISEITQTPRLPPKS